MRDSVRELPTLHTPSLARPFPLVKALNPPSAVRIALAESDDAGAPAAPQSIAPEEIELELDLASEPEVLRATDKNKGSDKADDPTTNVMPSARRARDRAKGSSIRSKVAVFFVLAIAGAAVGAGLQRGGSALTAHSATTARTP